MEDNEPERPPAAAGGEREPEPSTGKRTARAILQQQIEEEEEQLEYRPMGLFLSGLSAGLDVGFGPFLMAVMLTLTAGALPAPVTGILMANAYSIGFIVVVLGGSALFTEHTTLAVLPVLDGRAPWSGLARIWSLIYAGNIVGAAGFSFLAALVGPSLHVVEPAAFAEIARGLVGYGGGVILLSGVLAGWMMGLVSWLVTSARDTISQIVFVWLVTTGIGLAHLHHSIAGTVEVFTGMLMTPEIGLLDFGHFLLWSTVGNAIGGVFFVGVIKYSYVVRSTPERGLRIGYYSGGQRWPRDPSRAPPS